jgi:L-lactate utilization protein LutB
MTEIIKKTIKNLEQNGMECFYAERKEDVLPIAKDLIPNGAVVGVGGSVTLNETGVMALLRNGDYEFLDREAPGLSPKEIEDVMKKCLLADWFLTSSNAVTEKGEIYNVDGRGNRLAALNFGPDNVLIIIGKNKIVKDLKEAELRVKSVAAHKNAVRLSCATPCAKLGKCISLSSNEPHLTEGCACEQRICRNYLVLGKQKNDGRIKVIICGEALGY